MEDNFLDLLFKAGQDSILQRQEQARQAMEKLGEPKATFTWDDVEFGVWKVTGGFWIIPRKENGKWDWFSRGSVADDQFLAMRKATEE